jgi:hypothetical protein
MSKPTIFLLDELDTETARVFRRRLVFVMDSTGKPAARVETERLDAAGDVAWVPYESFTTTFTSLVIRYLMVRPGLIPPGVTTHIGELQFTPGADATEPGKYLYVPPAV